VEPEREGQRRDAVPFRIEDFLPGRGGFTLRWSAVYESLDADSSVYRLLPFELEPFGATVALPLAADRREVSDSLHSRFGLGFGLTPKLSLSGSAGFAVSRSREQLGAQLRSLADNDGFAGFDIGISYKLTRPSDPIYATLSLSAPLIERVGGKLEGAGSTVVSVSAFHVRDPLVLFVSLAYAHPREREIDGVRTRPGHAVTLRPGVAFAVNPWMTLDWSVTLANAGRARIDGVREGRAMRTLARLGLGLSWSLSAPLRMQIASEFGLAGARDARLGVNFSYRK